MTSSDTVYLEVIVTNDNIITFQGCNIMSDYYSLLYILTCTLNTNAACRSRF